MVWTSDGAASVGGEKVAFGGYFGGIAPGLPDGSEVGVKERSDSDLTWGDGSVSHHHGKAGSKQPSARGGRRLLRPVCRGVPATAG